MFTLQPVILLSASLLSTASPIAVLDLSPTAEDCVVNSRLDATWHEYGLQRRRTIFYSKGTPTDAYCDIFRDYAIGNYGSNIQCWHDQTTGWTVDASFALGPAGDRSYETVLRDSRSAWIQRTGCATG